MRLWPRQDVASSSTDRRKQERMGTHVVKSAGLEGGMRVGRILTPYHKEGK